MRSIGLVLAFALAGASLTGCCKLLQHHDDEKDTPSKESSASHKESPAPHKESPASSPAGKQAPASEPAEGWTDLSSSEGKFTIRMVDGAKLSREKTETALGPLEIVTWLGEKGPRVYYLSFVDYPKGKMKNVDGALDGARDGAVKNIHGKILNEKQLTVGGYKARDLSVAAEAKGIAMGLRMRFIMRGDRMYTLQVIHPGATAADIDADATKYFDSLHFTK